MKTLSQKLGNLLRFHLVKLGMLLFSVAFCIHDITWGTEHSKYFLALLILFQIRGISWEEKYRQQNVKLAEENEILRER